MLCIFALLLMGFWRSGSAWKEGEESDLVPSSAVFEVPFQQVLRQNAVFEVDSASQQLVVKRVATAHQETCAQESAHEEEAEKSDGPAARCDQDMPVAASDRLLSVDGQRVSLMELQQVIDSEPGTSQVLPIFRNADDDFVLTGFLRVEVLRPQRLQFRATSTARQQELNEWLQQQETLLQREVEKRLEQEAAQRERERFVQEQLARKDREKQEELAMQRALELEMRKQRMTPHHEVPSLRRSGQEFRYEVVFTTKGPIGLNWDLQTHDRTLVSHLESNMVAARQNVIEPKDQLIQLNDINTTSMGPHEVVQEFIKAQVPRRMVFLCAEKPMPASTGVTPSDASEAATEQGFALSFAAPSILKGWSVELVLAPWSAISEEKLFNKSIPMLSAIPSDGCSSIESALSPQQQERIARNSVGFLSYRGVCSFTDKASRVQDANGDLLVIVNNANGDARFPDAIPILDNIRIPITMISKEEGDFVLSVLDQEKEAVVTVNRRHVTSKEIAIVDVSKMNKEELNIARDPLRGGVKLHFWFLDISESASSVVNNEQFIVLPALFGARINLGVPYRLVMAYPMETACHPQGLRILTTRAIVLAKRGGCSFATKLKAIQDVGAMGMIMINTDAALLPLMSDPREAMGLTIWAATINRTDGTRLEQVLLENKNLPSLVKIDAF